MNQTIPHRITTQRSMAILITGCLMLGFAVFAVGSASAQAMCTDGSRQSAADIATDYNKRDHRENTIPEPLKDGPDDQHTVKLRYAEAPYHCVWALISGPDGSTAWIDRRDPGAANWDGPLGMRAIRSGNGTTYTAAYSVAGREVRACGTWAVPGKRIFCTSWFSESNPVPAGAGSAQSNTTSPAAPNLRSSTIIGDVNADSTSVPCASGTTDAGVADGFHNKIGVKIRLCSVESLPSTGDEDSGKAKVNSRVSGAIVALVDAANKAGIHLTATSSFRSMPHQQSLCQQNSLCRSGNYSAVAPPGTSNHQMGLAIDFTMPQVKGGQTCATRAINPTDSSWVWLRDNAAKWGYHQYSAESWHWDPVSAANRC